MIFGLLAEITLLLHGLFILWAVLGALTLLRWPRLLVLHLPAALWAAAVVGLGWICPLTPLENHLRGLAGEEGYSGGFLEYYLISLIYPPGLTRELQIGLAVAVVLINALLYLVVWRRRRRARSTLEMPEGG